jgi:hypothetical protein
MNPLTAFDRMTRGVTWSQSEKHHQKAPENLAFILGRLEITPHKKTVDLEDSRRLFVAAFVQTAALARKHASYLRCLSFY